MARKRGVDPYPKADALARTFLKDDVHLSGARQFLASEGLIVYTAQKEGASNVVGRTWLRPSAYRRISDYLDLRMNPSVSGYRISRLPVRRGQLSAVTEDLFEQFKVAAETTKNKVIDPDRGLQLRYCGEANHSDWAWYARLGYENVLKIADGQRIIGDASVDLYARRGPSDTVDVAVVSLRSGDVEIADAWLKNAAGSTRGWQAAPIGMAEDDLIGELRRIERAIAVGKTEVVAWSNPHFDRHAGIDTDAGESLDEFVSKMRGAKYDTDWLPLEVVEKRLSGDSAAVTHMQIVVHEKHARRGSTKDDPEPVIVLRVAQRLTSAHLFLHWHGARHLPSDLREVPLSRGVWENLGQLGWDVDQKCAYVLSRWSQILAALDAGAEDADADAGDPAARSRADSA